MPVLQELKQKEPQVAVTFWLHVIWRSTTQKELLPYKRKAALRVPLIFSGLERYSAFSVCCPAQDDTHTSPLSTHTLTPVLPFDVKSNPRTHELHSPGLLSIATAEGEQVRAGTQTHTSFCYDNYVLQSSLHFIKTTFPYVSS